MSWLMLEIEAMSHVGCVRNLMILKLLALAMVLPGCTKSSDADWLSSESWISTFQSVDPSISGASLSDHSAYGAKDSSGNLFLSTTANNAWVMYKSTDNGSTWTQEFSQSNYGLGYRIAGDSLGNVFAVGAYGTTSSLGPFAQ